MENMNWTYNPIKHEWTDQNGVSYSGDKKALIKCPREFEGDYCVPDSVKRIEKMAFEGCSMLNKVIIPNSVTYIGEGAFFNCYKLKKVYIPNSITSLESGLFLGCACLESVIIPDSVTSFGHLVFSGCSWIEAITIPYSVTNIGNRCFSACHSLYKITIPNSVASIGKRAFIDCSNLEEITIPNSVTTIEVETFQDCSNLKKVIIPNSVTSIGYRAFHGCYNLRKIDIPRSVRNIEEKAFWACPIKEVFLSPDTDYKKDSFDEVTKVIKAKVSISYSWDSEEHKNWVRKLAEDLQKKGVYVILDQWELKAGYLIPNFIQDAISKAERVLCIMTPNYKKKSEKLEGGVGFEYSIITKEIYRNIKGNKIIPILRGELADSCPELLSERIYIDFREKDSYKNSLKLLIREIYKAESL